jgi:MoxR-like ATPase
MSTQVNLNIEDCKDFLKHMIQNNEVLQESGQVPIAVNIEGPAGIGKTSMVKQIANELNLNMVRLNLATIEELGDLIGFPIRQFQLCKINTAPSEPLNLSKSVSKIITVMKKVTQEVTENKIVKKQVMGADGKLSTRDVMSPVIVKKEVEIPVEEIVTELASPVFDMTKGDECLWIDENAIEEYTKQGYSFTGEKRMSYCPPEWITGLDDKPGILILDDYSRADQRFIQATMTLIETHQYISWSLPKGWTILLTTNPDNGEYLVTALDIAQQTRFISVNLKFDAQIWGKWAEKSGIDGRCINFLLLHEELVTEKCNARAIVTFFNSLVTIKDFSQSLPLIQMIGEGSVGPEFSIMFTSFINNKLDKLISPETILKHDNEKHVVSELQGCIGTGSEYRADIASVLVTRLINYTLNFAENGAVTQKILDRLILLSIDPDIITNDLKYVLVKKILNGNKQKFQKLMTNPEVMKMAMK